MKIKDGLKRMLLAASVGLAVTLVFIILEWCTTTGFTKKDFPAMLFVLMWFNVGLLFFILGSVMRSLRKGVSRNELMVVVLKIILLIGLGWAFASILIDQMPCFLGVANCD